jgi:hypothetical protein
MKCTSVSKMHVCEIHLCHKRDETCWDMIPQPSVQQSNALPTELHGLVVNWHFMKAGFNTIHASKAQPASGAFT